MTKYIVEFWALPFKEVTLQDKPFRVDCASTEESIALERKLHANGWAARAVTITETRNLSGGN